MRQKQFNVTYEIITHESAADGDAAERGFIVEDVSLREAVEELGGVAWGDGGGGDWFTNYEYGTDYMTGAVEVRSLHPPDTITAASLGRLARLLVPAR
jgi:hypothetical protein